MLPVSNLTNLIVAERTDLTVTSLLAHLGSRASPRSPSDGGATAGGTPPGSPIAADALTPPTAGARCAIGGAIVAGVLVGFTVGSAVGIPPWVTALVADAVLVARDATSCPGERSRS